MKLNLRNEEVIAYLFDSIKFWVDEFDIDGLRLDVAYCLDRDFLKRLRGFCNGLKADFWLCGELLHGDYNQWVNDDMLHSCTNYECYKGMFRDIKEALGDIKLIKLQSRHLQMFYSNLRENGVKRT